MIAAERPGRRAIIDTMRFASAPGPPPAPFAALLGLLVLVVAASASATEVRFSKAGIEGGNVVASLSLPGLVGPKTEARLASGQPFETTVRFYIYGGREWWPDEQLAIVSLRLSARYDAATQEYTVARTLGTVSLPPLKAHSLDEARRFLEVHEALPVFAIRPEWRGERVFLRARVKLGTDYILGVIPTESWTDRASSHRFVIP